MNVAYNISRNCSFHTHDTNAHYSLHGATAFTEINNENFSLLTILQGGGGHALLCLCLKMCMHMPVHVRKSEYVSNLLTICNMGYGPVIVGDNFFVNLIFMHHRKWH
jgi:hypothetical protein